MQRSFERAIYTTAALALLFYFFYFFFLIFLFLIFKNCCILGIQFTHAVQSNPSSGRCRCSYQRQEI